VHHEFGYFYGFHRRAHFSQDVSVIGKRLRYLRAADDEQRPGMYQHFQDFAVESFNDPVALARIIAQEIGADFVEPDDPGSLLMPAHKSTDSPPHELAGIRLGSTTTSGNPNTSTGTAELDIRSPVTLYDVQVAGWHPRVEVMAGQPEPQVPGEGKGRVRLSLRWQEDEGPPDTLVDSAGRGFQFARPQDPGEDWYPFYITFDAGRHGIWALVTYFKVTTHSKGWPDFTRFPRPAPCGWVPGQKSP